MIVLAEADGNAGAEEAEPDDVDFTADAPAAFVAVCASGLNPRLEAAGTDPDVCGPPRVEAAVLKRLDMIDEGFWCGFLEWKREK